MSLFLPSTAKLILPFVLWGGLGTLAGGTAAHAGTASTAEDNAPSSSSSSARSRDLDELQRWIQIEQSWPSGTLEVAETMLTELRKEASQLNDAEFYVRVAALAALADNGHTGLSSKPVYASFGLVPIRTCWFDDGLYVVRATEAQRRLLGARVLRIAGLSPQELMKRMQSYAGGSVEAFRVYDHTEWFLSPALLHAAGLTLDATRIPIELELSSGAAETLALDTHTSSGEHPGGRVWRQLLPKALPEEEVQWSTWLGDSGASIPWALQDPDRAFRYRFLKDSKISHIQFRLNTNTKTESIRDFLKELEGRLKTDRPRVIVWDQRWNSGGDLTRTADFSRRLHRWLPRHGQVFVLTSNATFSAGIYTAFFPKWAEPSRTTIVGTRVGDRERFWAESNEPFTLPESGWRLYYSLQFHNLAEGCNDRGRCHISRSRWNISVGSFEPEITIPWLASDLISGRDPVLEGVLARIGSADN